MKKSYTALNDLYFYLNSYGSMLKKVITFYIYNKTDDEGKTFKILVSIQVFIYFYM